MTSVDRYFLQDGDGFKWSDAEAQRYFEFFYKSLWGDSRLSALVRIDRFEAAVHGVRHRLTPTLYGVMVDMVANIRATRPAAPSSAPDRDSSGLDEGSGAT